ncbi:hypothetical protein LCGC14_0481440 [marine sediment metagenome]|uniref:SF4 helicase domain-containing protein n=1 Tax=marine sediment metagenome TaxID=412755 RepID=A0A0F9SEG7_9ZZZZ
MATASPNVKTEAKQAVRPPQFRIETVEQKERYLKLLIYGNYGVGKTTLAASALMVPSMRDVLLISAEAGDLSVSHMKGLDATTIRDFKALGYINEFLKQHCKARDEDNEKELIKLEAFNRGVEASKIKKAKRYNTVIVDSLTEVEAYCFNQLLSITDATRLDTETQSSEWTEYKKNHTMMLRVVRAFRDLPMHVIVTAAEQYQQDETKKMKFSPDLTGKLSKKVQGFFDMVGYYQQARKGDDLARRLYVMPSPSGRYDAKHRYQTYKGEYFDNPTIGTILKEVGLLDKGGASLK